MTVISRETSKNFVSQVIGPISLLCTLFLVGRASTIPNFDLAFIAILGLYLCAKWRFRGLFLALGLLSLSALGKHFFFTNYHVWQAGFEFSVACGWFIATLIFEANAKSFESIKAQNLAQSQTIEFIEEDLARVKSLAAEESLHTADKITQLQSQLEEALTESSSYQILNDVLRKSTSRAIEEKEQCVLQIFQADRRAGQLLSEIDVLQKELARIGDERAIVQQNEQLFSELNQARFKEAQTHLVNETLARMHRSENARVKELEAKQGELTCQLLKSALELEQDAALIDELNLKIEELSLVAQRQYDLHQEGTQQLEEALVQAQTLYANSAAKVAEIEPLNLHLSAQVKMLEEDLAHSKLQALPATMTPEREADLIDQIASLVKQQELLKEEVLSTEGLKEQVESLQARMKQYAELELLYRQLKGNFQSKNEVLHQTRVQLFHVDTELQTLKQQIEEENVEADPLLPKVAVELEEMEVENRALMIENTLLNEIITQLMNSSHQSHVPLERAVEAEFKHLTASDQEATVKRVKKEKALAEQQNLF